MDLLSTINDMKDLEKEFGEEELHEEKTSIRSEFADLYKANTLKYLSQAERRENLLQSLKVRRHQNIDEKRNLTDLFENFEETRYDEECEAMDVVKPYKKRHKKSRLKVLKNKLMMSEWFSEIPSDLELNWLFKLCPNGVRNLVIAYKHKTVAFSIEGKRQAIFRSHLPGGGPHSAFNKFTVLDCVYNIEQKCYYVLDVLAWNGFLLKNNNTEFRFYWIKSKLDETNELRVSTLANPFIFVEVKFEPAQLSLIEEKLTQPFSENDEVFLDGIIFYHREVIYIEDKTPLVGWLKPYMVPEMLGLPVHNSYLSQKPKGYICLQQYLQNKHSKKKDHKHLEQMEC